MKETTSKQTKKNNKNDLGYSIDDEYINDCGYLTDLGISFLNDFFKAHSDDSDYFLCALYVCLYNRGDCLFTDDDVLDYAQKKIKNCPANDFKILNKIILSIDSETLDLVLRDHSSYSQIDSHEDNRTYLNEVVYNLFLVGPDETILDFGSGNGSFLVDSFILSRDYNMSLYESQGKIGGLIGIESDSDNVLISKLRLRLLARGMYDIDVEKGDISSLSNFEGQYTCGYIHPAIGQHQLFKNKTYKSLLYPDITFDNSFYEQWLYVDRFLASFTAGGSAVALLHGKSLMQIQNNEYAQRLLDDGWIEGIIELHDSPIINYLGTIPYLIVFSKGNTRVKVSCADEVNDYNYYVNTNNDLCDGLQAVFYWEPDKHPEIITEFTINEMKEFNSWIPSRMPVSEKHKKSTDTSTIRNLASVIQTTQYTASDFEISDNPTGYKILTPAEIDNGQIKWDELKSVVINKTLFDKYVLRKDDLIMTNKTTKIKTAVVDISPEEKVIVTGGMLIIRPDTDKLNPTYLKMYLDSPEGDIALRTSQTGSSVINLSPVLVENIEIPMVDIEKQNKKADSYNSKLASVNAYRENIKKLEQDMRYIFDEEDD